MVKKFNLLNKYNLEEPMNESVVYNNLVILLRLTDNVEMSLINKGRKRKRPNIIQTTRKKQSLKRDPVESMTRLFDNLKLSPSDYNLL